MSALRYKFKISLNHSDAPCVPCRYPWWREQKNNDHNVMICYLPEMIHLRRYWSEAYDVEVTGFDDDGGRMTRAEIVKIFERCDPAALLEGQHQIKILGPVRRKLRRRRKGEADV